MAGLNRDFRDTLLFLAGLAGIAYETIAQNLDRPELLVLFAGMVGLPAFLRGDEKWGGQPSSGPQAIVPIGPPPAPVEPPPVKKAAPRKKAPPKKAPAKKAPAKKAGSAAKTPARKAQPQRGRGRLK